MLCIVCSSCQTTAPKDKLFISAAASTQFVVRQLADCFEKEHNIPVEVIIGSSGKLTNQIINGAPFDVFISADTFYPERLEQEGKVLGVPYIYGNGIPVIWSLDTSLNFKDIQETFLSDAVKKIAIADPKNAPYGTQAIKYLKNMGIYDQIESKIVYGESISQVNEYILSRSVQIGLSAKSVLSSEKLRGRGKHNSLDTSYHIAQAMVLVKNDRNNEPKKLFLRFVKSAACKTILKEYGLL